MIVVDTSVWVQALRSRESLEAEELSHLLDEDRVALPAAVRLEILSGAGRRELPLLRRLLAALPVLYPERSTWDLATSWIEPSRRRGERFGFADLLIGAQAAESDAAVWSNDKDFERLASMGLIRLHEPQAEHG